MGNQAFEADPNGPATSAEPRPFNAPHLSLPTGGGAIRGIGEKFAANLVTGTGSLTIPISTSPGRSGFGPQVSLAYNSGIGSGAFGLGWSLSLPSITRRTDKGLPRYNDFSPAELPDIFILSGAEDLVPALQEDSNGTSIHEDQTDRDGYQVEAYRPRTEGLFARIERWTCRETGIAHWRSISRDNILTVYGLDAASRIADPDQPLHVFSWLICRSYDASGNAIVYEYTAENGANVDVSLPSERNRQREANRYLRRIRYGNRRPILLDPTAPGFRAPHLSAQDPDSADWTFSVVFDYGEGRYREEPPDPEGRVFVLASVESRVPWPARLDPFSTFRSGFEVRTHRLCRHVLMFHHFPGHLGADECLVRSTTFHYRERPFGSFIDRVVQAGHTRRPDGQYLTRALPTLDLAYTRSPLEDSGFETFVPRDVDEESLANLPGGVDGQTYRWLDLDGEGIAGVLADQGGAWLYKHNLGEGRFGTVETVKARPALAERRDPLIHLMDVAGDGNLDLVDLSILAPGFHGRTFDAGWQGFRAFRSLPVLNWNDPNLRFVDLTGDGIADILITEDDAYKWHPSLLEEGFGRGVRVNVPLDEEATGPRAIFADPEKSIYLADMTGDGLSDIVRIRNGEVCYWPNRGYGRFAAKVTMDRAPWFDEPDLFDQRRIRLSDTDGSGTTDILYLGRDGVQVYLNLAGNALSEARHIGRFPGADNVTAVDVADLLGRGTACLIWSSPLPRDARRQLRYIDLMCGRKPHLLSHVNNNMGASTRIEYASSTEFYLADKAAGAPWITRLAFPVHVVRRVETYDEVSRNRMVTRYTYHHGFFDGLEREFRGFARVDQLDTESFADIPQTEDFPVGDNWAEASNVPPVLTRTWFHTGVFLNGGRVSRHLSHEYFREPGFDAASLPDTILPSGLTAFETREACRALKGSMLRQEVYALDGGAKEKTPYTVSESNFTIVTVQPKGCNRYAVFFTHPREAVAYHCERNATDPRIGHELTLAVDRFGNVLRSAAIGYQRRDPAFPEQGQTLATLTEQTYTNPVFEPDAYRTPSPAEVKTYQLTAPELNGADLLTFAQVDALTASAIEIAYEMEPTPGQTQKRLVERARSIYRKNDLSALLPAGRQESLALPGVSYKLALTEGLLDVYGAKALPAELKQILAGPDAGYRDVDGDGPFWVSSGRVFCAPDQKDDELDFAVRHFFLPHRYVDPFGRATIVGYDDVFNLMPVMTRDAAGNETHAELDYRVLQPRHLIDPNRNRSEARFDALGMLAGTAVMGKADGPVEGDSFDDFVTDLSPHAIKRYFDAKSPRDHAVAHLGTATTRILYDLDCVPVCAASIARETHVSDLAPGQKTRVRLHFVYSDGFGREAQTKIQAEPGPLNLDDPDSPVADPRWVGTGAKMYNNKGKPVRQYEPFFSATPQFGIETWGVSSLLFYDPVERVVATLQPNHTFEKVVFDAWKQASFDANDTIMFDPWSDPDVGGFVRDLPESDYLPTWYRRRIAGELGPHEKIAAEKAAACANTPTVIHFDSLGRHFLTVADNGRDAEGVARLYAARTVFDIEGNPRAVIDALDRVVMRYEYDVLGTRIRQQSMEVGERWMLNDAVGKPLRSWNSRDFAFRMEYDELHRPLRSFVRGGEPSDPDSQFFADETLFERMIYGDSGQTDLSESQRRERNLRGKPFQHFDNAGVVATEHYDFKGNALTSTRQFAEDFKTTPDWSADVTLEAKIFHSASAYDALNRAVAVTAPDGSIYRPTFNDASLLLAVDVALRGAAREGKPFWTPFVSFINYDAKGQRTLIRYANGASTTYEYDFATFRLANLRTTRKTRDAGFAAEIFRTPETVQDLHYTYDPVGNITRIEDAALKTVFHANHRVDAVNDYTYDPLYRLLDATGRENAGQSAFSFMPKDGEYRDFPFVGAARRHDLQALRRFVERYDYDPVGNFRTTAHQAEGGNWERRYVYEEPSLIEPEKVSNRLSRTSVEEGPSTLVERYRHDAHGNMTRMPHLPRMRWDFHDQMRATTRQVLNEGTPEETWYVYDSAGQRVRKVTTRRDVGRKNERLYLGGFELFRTFNAGGGVELERETLHVMDDKRRIALVETLAVDDGRAIVIPGPKARYQLANHLGSASLELAVDCGLISYEEYSPYGSSTFQAGYSATELSLKRYRYTGKERDEENGFSYHRARYYAPWLGRWAAGDALFKPEFSNAYQYVRLNPIIFNDPTGRDWKKFWGGVRAAGGLVQAVGGVAFAAVTAETGVGIAGGLLVAAHGLSDYEAGIRQMQTGKEATSITEVAISSTLQAAHVDKDTADSAAKAADITLGFVNPSGPITGGPRAALALASGGQRLQAAAQVLPQLAAVSGGIHSAEAAHSLMEAHNEGGGSSDKPSDSSGGAKEPPPKEPSAQPAAGGDANATKPAVPAASVPNPDRAAAVQNVLSQVGVGGEQAAGLLRGEATVFSLPAAGGEPTLIAVKLEGSRLSSGIVSIKFPEGASVADKLKAFASFRGISRQIAQAAGATELEIHGIAVINPEIKEMLLRQGFKLTTIDVPAALGGGKAESFSKVFPVNRAQ
ncbi:MAG: SpvB/TcaC N-terminal domain-containing protein [Rhodomicrobium sp.]